jgi:peptide/nickel transport system substrate-binding protein
MNSSLGRFPVLMAAGLLVGSLIACTTRGGCSGDHCGALVIAAPGEPDILLPPIARLATARDVSDQLFLKLADVGMSANTIGDDDFVPQLAARWDWTDSVTLTFHLDPRAKWHDGVPVTAGDVAFTFDIYSDSTVASPSRSALREIITVTARDSLTAVFRFRRPYAEMFYDAVYHMRVLPAHLLRAVPRTAWQTAPFGREPIGDGPYRFVRWKAGESLELAADSTFFLGRPHLRRLIWRFTPNLEVAITQLIAGQADAIEVLGPPDNVKRVHDVAGLAAYPYRGTTYGFLAFNLRANGDTSAPHPVFGSRDVRRAIVRALDRESMLRNVWGDLAAVPPGPMPRLWPLWEKNLAGAMAHDSVQAARLLAQRSRRAFHLLVPTTSGLRRQYARLIQAQLQPFGWDVRIDEVEFSVVQERVGTGRFDAVLGAWASGPSPIDGTLQNWTRRGFGGANAGRYDNPQLDRLLEGAAQARSRDAAIRLLGSAMALWNSDAPAAPLYAPDNVAAVNRRVSEVTIRPDSWLALVRLWRIPASQLSDRDRVGT